MKRLLPLYICVLCVAASACGGNSYGSKNDFNGSGGGGNLSLSDPTPSATPASSLGSHAPPPPPSPKPVASQAPPAAHFQITINSDTSGQPDFYPPAAEVYTGTIITFVNKDSVPRSVISDQGAPASFNSGMIAPGASWSYTASVAGQFNYHDGTRPYAVAYFKAVAH